MESEGQDLVRPNEVLPRSEVIRRFEIDCGDGILFPGGSWQPGGEYVQKLVIKNCSARMAKIKYSLPKSKYFTMAFPELITLSPGTSAVIDVVFRPVELEEYDDSVYLTVYSILNGRKEGGGGFHVPVIAKLAKLDVTIPKGLDFGFCPTKETVSKKFTLINSGQLRLRFNWTLAGAGDLGTPIRLEPSTGELDPGATCEITAFLWVERGVVLVSTSICHYQELGGAQQSGSTAMKISAIGKYAHIAASESHFNFGEIQIGTTGTEDCPAEKEFVIRNQSLVPASFEIIPLEQDHEPVFHFSLLKGRIAPESELKMNIRYTPLNNGTFSCDNFKVVTPGGNSIQLCCTGKAVGPSITLSARGSKGGAVEAKSRVIALNFNDVEVGKIESRTIYIDNRGYGPAYFAFLVEDKGIFEFDVPQGKIPPRLQQTVTIRFKPTDPINYYKRVFLLFKDQMPFCLDLLGTGYDEKARPPPMHTGQVYAKRVREEKGYGDLSPEELEALLAQGHHSLFPGDNVEGNENLGDVEEKLVTRSGEATILETKLCKEFYSESTDSKKQIFLSESELDFGGNLFGKLGERKSIIVTNNTHTKISCYWNIPESDDDDDVPDFEVLPPTADVPAGKSLEFKVVFRPSQENFFYCQEIEVFCFHKANRNFRLVNPKTLTPPWCLPVRVLGHTYGPHSEHFLPKVSFMVKESKVAFPPCHLGDSIYQTIMLENNGDTPAQFRFIHDPSNIFSIKPDGGMIPTQGFQLVMLRFTPKKPKSYTDTLQCLLNNAVGTKIQLIGQAFEPALEIEDISAGDQTLYFKPTSITLSSSRTFKIHNISRIPLIYRWDIPPKVQGVLAVDPRLGRLKGNERATVTCKFTPDELKEYRNRISLKYRSVAQNLTEVNDWSQITAQTSIRVCGEGISGALSFHPETLRLGAVLVNTEKVGDLVLINSSDCDLKFTLSSSIAIQGLEDVSSAESQDALRLTPTDGVISARSRLRIVATFKPQHQATYLVLVKCRSSIQEPTEQFSKPEAMTACKLEVIASFPTIRIVDIRSNRIPTSILYDQFQVARLNEFLSSPLTREEIVRNEDTRALDTSRLPRYPFGFVPQVLGSAPEEVILELSNRGGIATEFVVRYPNEKEVELERWDDEGQPTAEQVQQNWILDADLFTVNPRRGAIEPNKTQQIRITYSYHSIKYNGVHKVPIVFQLSKGKQLVWELQGRTLPTNTPLMFIKSETVDLTPVPIGLERVPLQTFYLYNAGDCPFEYQLDRDGIEKEKEDNFGLDIFCIKNPRGTVDPMSKRAIHVTFTPLEARLYTTKVTLSVYQTLEDGVSAGYAEEKVLHLTARGFHPLRAGDHNTSKPSASEDGPPVKPMIKNTMLTLSHVRLQFGILPMGSVTSHIITLRNTATAVSPGLKPTIFFEWDRTHPLVRQGIIQFSLLSGRIEPDSSLLVTVHLRADHCDTPIALMEDLSCTVIPLHDAAAESPKGSLKGTFAIQGGGEAAPVEPTRSSVLRRSTMNWDARLEENKAWKDVAEYLRAEAAGQATSLETFMEENKAKKAAKALATRPTTRESQSAAVQKMGLNSKATPVDETAFLAVSALIVDQDEYGKYHLGPSSLSFQLPKTAPFPALAAGGRAKPTPERMNPLMVQSSRTLCREVLQSLVANLVDTVRLHGVSSLLPEKRVIPFFRQFQKDSRTPREPSLFSSQHSAVERSLLVQSEQWSPSQVECLRNSECQDLLSEVLENTLENLMKEAMLGEFNVRQPPKQYFIMSPNAKTAPQKRNG